MSGSVFGSWITSDSRSNVSSVGSYNNVVGACSDVSLSSSSCPSGNTSIVSSLGTSAGYSMVQMRAPDVTSVVADSNASSQTDSTIVTERTYASISVGPDDSSSLVQTDVSDVSDFVAYRRT